MTTLFGKLRGSGGERRGAAAVGLLSASSSDDKNISDNDIQHQQETTGTDNETENATTGGERRRNVGGRLFFSRPPAAGAAAGTNGNNTNSLNSKRRNRATAWRAKGNPSPETDANTLDSTSDVTLSGPSSALASASSSTLTIATALKNLRIQAADQLAVTAETLGLAKNHNNTQQQPQDDHTMTPEPPALGFCNLDDVDSDGDDELEEALHSVGTNADVTNDESSSQPTVHDPSFLELRSSFSLDQLEFPLPRRSSSLRSQGDESSTDRFVDVSQSVSQHSLGVRYQDIAQLNFDELTAMPSRESTGKADNAIMEWNPSFGDDTDVATRQQELSPAWDHDASHAPNASQVSNCLANQSKQDILDTVPPASRPSVSLEELASPNTSLLDESFVGASQQGSQNPIGVSYQDAAQWTMAHLAAAASTSSSNLPQGGSLMVLETFSEEDQHDAGLSLNEAATATVSSDDSGGEARDQVDQQRGEARDQVDQQSSMAPGDLPLANSLSVEERAVAVTNRVGDGTPSSLAQEPITSNGDDASDREPRPSLFVHQFQSTDGTPSIESFEESCAFVAVSQRASMNKIGGVPFANVAQWSVAQLASNVDELPVEDLAESSAWVPDSSLLNMEEEPNDGAIFPRSPIRGELSSTLAQASSMAPSTPLDSCNAESSMSAGGMLESHHAPRPNRANKTNTSQLESSPKTPCPHDTQERSSTAGTILGPTELPSFQVLEHHIDMVDLMTDEDDEKEEHETTNDGVAISSDEKKDSNSENDKEPPDKSGRSGFAAFLPSMPTLS